MSTPTPTITVPVDVTNPGQFFACCGLLELADRLWPGAEGWFEDGEFALTSIPGVSAESLHHELLECPEFSVEMSKQKALNGSNFKLLPITLSFRTAPLVIDWWRDETRPPSKKSKESSAASVFKTWAGNQSPQQIVYDKLLPEIRTLNERENNWVWMRRPLTGRFGFDYTTSVTGIDGGFSPDAHDVAVSTAPGLELMAMIGLQRFRPSPTKKSFTYTYCIWNEPLPLAAAAAQAACGRIVQGQGTWIFSIDKRGDYKFFTKAFPQT